MLGTGPAPTLEPRDDGLRRSAPVSRAVREPLPARPAGEVPRLRARPRLVARAPTRAPGRLPRRLLRALEGGRGERRALLAVPALRPARVGVLLDLAAVGLAQPGREREPDPQGALPAAARAAVDGGDAARGLRGDARCRARALPDLPAGLPRHRLAGP